VLNYKREQQLSYAQQALSQQLQQESGAEMDTLVSGVKSLSKHIVKKDILISMVRRCCISLYAEDK
jgi:outer membrane protein